MQQDFNTIALPGHLSEADKAYVEASYTLMNLDSDGNDAPRDHSAVHALLDKALALDPAHVHSWITKGALLRKSGDTDAAETCLKTALSIQPDNLMACYLLKLILHADGRDAELIPYLEANVRANPGSEDMQAALACVLMDAGRNEEAIASYRQAIRLATPKHSRSSDTTIFSSLYNIGDAQEKLGRFSDAEASFTAAAKVAETLGGKELQSQALEAVRRVSPKPPGQA